MTTPYFQDDLVTLYHGDCREVEDWLAADVLVTDPPYGMSWVSGSMFTDYRPAAGALVAGDDDTAIRDWVLTRWAPRPAVVFGTWRVPRPANTTHRLIWFKTKAAPGLRSSPWYPAEEEIYVLGSGFGGKPQQNVLVSHELRLGANGAAAKSGHPTPKPVPIMEMLIQKCPEGVIADPFAGSGSTLMAAKLQGRRAVGVELDERYCEAAAGRLSQGVLDFGEVMV